jgi:hypothetical protein
MPLKCSVRGCPSLKKNENQEVTSLHRFPLNNKSNLAKEWLEKLGEE